MHAREIGAVLLPLLLAAGGLPAAPAFRAVQSFPAVGLRFKTLAGAAPQPLEQPSTYTYTVTRGGESQKLDLIDPAELWRATQFTGRWRDKSGNVFLLASPTCRCPEVASPYSLPHVSREDCEAALAAAPRLAGSAAPEDFLPWLDDYLGADKRTAAPLRRNAFGTVAAAARFTDSDPRRLVYAFQVKPKAFGAGGGEPAWFIAVLTLADGTPPDRARADFEAQFLASVAAIPRTGPAARELSLARKGPAPARSLAAPAEPAADGPSTNAAAVAARRSIANLKGWWFAETPEYIFLSDVRGSTGKRLIADLRRRLPALRKGFVAAVPPESAGLDVGVVRIFETRESYLSYLGGELAFSVGCWVPMRRELCILSQGADASGRGGTLAVIQHEAFHQYLFYATGGAENAVWYNEGLACFFGAAEIDSRGRVTVPPDADRCRAACEHPGAVAALVPQLVALDHAGFYAGGEEEIGQRYVAAWALAYYLSVAEPGRLAAYRDAFRRDRDAARATAAALPPGELPGLCARLEKFYRRLRAPRPLRLF